MNKEEEIRKEIEELNTQRIVLCEFTDCAGNNCRELYRFSNNPTKKCLECGYRINQKVDNSAKISLLQAELKGIQEGKQDRDKEIEAEIDKMILGKKQAREYTTYEDIHSDEACYNEQIKELEAFKSRLKPLQEKKVK